MIALLALECRELLQQLFPLVNQLRCITESTTGFVFYQQGNDDPLQGQAARNAISAHLGEMHYPGIEDIGLEPAPRFMAMAMPADSLPLIQAVNEAKKALQQWHEALARTQPNSYAAAQMNRAVLKRAQEPLLNLQMAERAVIWLEGPPVRLSWHYNTTSNSRRKSLGDVLVALEKLADKLPDYRSGDIESVRNRLASLPLDTPVAYRPSKPVTHLKCQYRYLNAEGAPQRGVCYAKNPIFYPETLPAPKPAIALPAEVQGKTPRSGAGRPSIISDKPVTTLLPNWFWYKSTE